MKRAVPAMQRSTESNDATGSMKDLVLDSDSP
jgi:hypothetical protein